MEIKKTIYVTNKKQWRSWLAKNHKKEKEIWLIYYKKSSNKKRIPYDDAVEEALCYGWIDSTVKSIDSEKYAQRFTPRRTTSILSELNRQRINKLIKQKKMTIAGLKAVAHVFKTKKEKININKDILRELRKNQLAWKNFQRLPSDYKQIRIAYIESQRKHSNKMFKKALNNFIEKTSRNKKFGMMT